MRTEESKLLKITSKWWFFVGLIMAQMLIWPYSTKNFSFQGIGEMINYTLGYSLQIKISDSYLFFQIIAITVLLLLFFLKNKFAMIFNVYVFLSYILFAVLQNVAITDKYGLSVVTINVVMFLLVAFSWLMEILKPENDYSFINFDWKKSWMIVLSFFAFWLPLNNGVFDLNLKHLFLNGSSLTFCMMTPVFLTIMTLNLPSVKIATYRITAIVGIIIGLYNMMNFQHPDRVDLAIIHLPLLIISLYAAIKSFKIKKYGKEIQ